ncbi:conserved hypothetical protein [Uncinocarpus reesii 1704]|uniref:Uncharacterized protein n=1 Tax=Uncinocarpus reesii (strain UAMH 1704) TaxID=336963 RepID=C4JV66_UNCRE|nr:uncharacterized protein UREG_06458 [Uncinocarpus reesii 1704]EEP81593.1 conserved hypothetical protein [Uncinocarpus reesii 1704]
MASAITIPSFLLPRAIPKSASSHILLRRTPAKPSASRRCASTSSPKPRVLEKPDKFRPPSHPARRVLSPQCRAAKLPRPAAVGQGA